LSTLRERLKGWREFKPRSETTYELSEPEGRLYEYLEGVLLRGVGDRASQPREVAVYDLRKVGEWVDEEGEEEGEAQREGEGIEAGSGVRSRVELENEEDVDIRRSKRFGFQVGEFAVDPGLDLLVLIEVRFVQPRPSSLIMVSADTHAGPSTPATTRCICTSSPSPPSNRTPAPSRPSSIGPPSFFGARSRSGSRSATRGFSCYTTTSPGRVRIWFVGGSGLLGGSRSYV
jgi:hypothetical protein